MSELNKGEAGVHAIIDTDRYPLERLESSRSIALLEDCRQKLATDGMFNLDGFLRPGVAEQAASEIAPLFPDHAFTHARRHNIYFQKGASELPADHPALVEYETVNHTICADQIPGSIVMKIYEWPPLAAFLARVMGKSALHPMADPLARANVMSYGAGEALNWHFDRSEFTTTLLLQAPRAGGVFEYRTDLRTPDDPNFEGVAALLEDRDPLKRSLTPKAGALNVFKGKNTPHRVTPIEGERDRIIGVFSYFERDGVMFTDEERIGFYGRAG
ncbi:MAG: 2OG-Fe(II) oxygenase [Pseudomonadota bacterium]